MNPNLDRPISEPARRPRPRCPLCNGALVEVMLEKSQRAAGSGQQAAESELPAAIRQLPAPSYLGCLGCAILSAEPYAEWHDFGVQKENA